MTREEYKMIQNLIDYFYRDHLSSECYNLLHDIKSELGVLYSTKLRYPNHYDISGYRYEELVAVAKLLNEKHIKPQELTHYMDYFQCGFDYCNKLSKTFLFENPYIDEDNKKEVNRNEKELASD